MADEPQGRVLENDPRDGSPWTIEKLDSAIKDGTLDDNIGVRVRLTSRSGVESDVPRGTLHLAQSTPEPDS